MASQQTITFAALSVCLMLAVQTTTCEANSPKDGGPKQAQEATAADAHLKQSTLWPNFLWPIRTREKPNLFLLGIKPYQAMLPKPVQDMIEQQIRPQTDDLSAQILSSVPGAEQMYQQVSSFMDVFSSFGPASFLGGNEAGEGGASSGLANLVNGFGGRR